MGSLRTFGWTNMNDKEEIREMVVCLSKVTHAVEFDDRTSLLSLEMVNDVGSSMIRVDLSIQQMEQILHRHEQNPSKKQRTHGITGATVKKEKGSGNHK